MSTDDILHDGQRIGYPRIEDGNFIFDKCDAPNYMTCAPKPNPAIRSVQNLGDNFSGYADDLLVSEENAAAPVVAQPPSSPNALPPTAEIIEDPRKEYAHLPRRYLAYQKVEEIKKFEAILPIPLKGCWYAPHGTRLEDMFPKDRPPPTNLPSQNFPPQLPDNLLRRMAYERARLPSNIFNNVDYRFWDWLAFALKRVFGLLGPEWHHINGFYLQQTHAFNMKDPCYRSQYQKLRSLHSDRNLLGHPPPFSWTTIKYKKSSDWKAEELKKCKLLEQSPLLFSSSTT